jgi:DNA-binding transcriptional ArsR family regulator
LSSNAEVARVRTTCPYANPNKLGIDGFSLLSRVLELAGNEVRLKILYLLHTEGELCPCDLSDILELSVPAVSQHLRKLKDGNVIKFRKEGQTIYYSLRDDHLEILRPFFKWILPLKPTF